MVLANYIQSFPANQVSGLLTITSDSGYADIHGSGRIIFQTEAITQLEVTQSITYVVKSGDSLWKIAKTYYGAGTKWEVLYAANSNTISLPCPFLDTDWSDSYNSCCLMVSFARLHSTNNGDIKSEAKLASDFVFAVCGAQRPLLLKTNVFKDIKRNSLYNEVHCSPKEGQRRVSGAIFYFPGLLDKGRITRQSPQ